MGLGRAGSGSVGKLADEEFNEQMRHEGEEVPAGEGTPAREVEPDGPAAPQAESARGGGGVAVALIALAIAAIAAVGLAWKLYSDLATAERALQAAAGAVDTLVKDTAPLATRPVYRALGKRDFAEAARAFEQIASLRPGRPAAGPAHIPPQLAAELGPEASAFFDQNPALLRRLLGLVQAARQLEDRGVDVEPLREVRDRILEAARLQNREDVVRLLGEFEDKLAELGGQPSRKRLAELRKRVLEARRAIEQAAKRGRDVRPAVELLKKADAAAKRGDYKAAEGLINRAIAAARSAKRIARRRPRHARARAGQAGPAAMRGPLGLILAMLRVEDRDLAAVRAELKRAQEAAQAGDARKAGELVAEARRVLEAIEKRRQEVSSRLQGRRGKGPTPAELEKRARERFEAAARAVEEFLARVRGLSEEEFAARKRELAVGLLRMLVGPPPGAGPQRPETPTERARRLLRLAREPYEKLKSEGADTAELEALFKQARQELWSGQPEKAIETAIRALEKMRDMLKAGEEAAGQAGEGQGAGQASQGQAGVGGGAEAGAAAAEPGVAGRAEPSLALPGADEGKVQGGQQGEQGEGADCK